MTANFFHRPPRRVAVLLTALPLLALVASNPAAVTATELARFTTHGIYKWTVPAGVHKVTFDVFGASGGRYVFNGQILASGGAGGEARGTFKVKPGQVFEILVGGAGESFTGNGQQYADGGVGGGGDGYLSGGGGGGASSVMIGGRGNTCAADGNCDHGDRIVVGGGGGGGSAQFSSGGSGGGANGSGDGSGAQEGRFTACPSNEGCFGRGGVAYFCASQTGNGPGGGGGWFGGSAGCNGQGGSGGSGFVSRLSISGGFPGGARYGDGMVVIRTA